MTPKERLHRLVEALPDREIYAAERFLEYLASAEDPVLRAIREAPEDDEPLTDEDRTAIEAGLEDYRQGRVISDKELGRRLGHDAA